MNRYRPILYGKFAHFCKTALNDVSVSVWALTKVNKKNPAFNVPMTKRDRERESVSVSVIVSAADNVLVMQLCNRDRESVSTDQGEKNTGS